MRQVYVDSLVHDPDVLELLLKKFGEDRIVLGSDYPFPLGEVARPGSLIEESHLSDDAKAAQRIKQKLLWQNAANLLKISRT